MLAFKRFFSDLRAVDAPGLFYYLVQDSILTLDALTPLLAILPPDEFVLSNLRDGEAFDSLRWPVAFDAEFATLAARCLDEPTVLQALQEIEQCRGDRLRLRSLARFSTARALAAMGGDADLFRQLWPDPSIEDLALFSAPRMPVEIATTIQSLAHAHYQAADGLYAFHLHRRLPGPSANPAASIVKCALEKGTLHVEELVPLAMGMIRRRTNAG